MRNLTYFEIKLEDIFLEPNGSECYIIDSSASNQSIKDKLALKIDIDKYLIDNKIIIVVFFDGSIPKREIKNVLYDDDKKEVIVETNKRNIKFSTMDYRYHQFVLVIENVKIEEAKYI